MKKLKMLATVDEEALIEFLLKRTAGGLLERLGNKGIYPETCTIQAMEHDGDSNKIHFHITAVAPDKLLELSDQIDELNKRYSDLVKLTQQGNQTQNNIPLRGQKIRS